MQKYGDMNLEFYALLVKAFNSHMSPFSPYTLQCGCRVRLRMSHTIFRSAGYNSVVYYNFISFKHTAFPKLECVKR